MSDVWFVRYPLSLAISLFLYLSTSIYLFHAHKHTSNLQIFEVVVMVVMKNLENAEYINPSKYQIPSIVSCMQSPARGLL